MTNTTMEAGVEKIVIKGLTQDGRRFRPSDWAQRLSTAAAAQMKGGRIRFHPRVRMAMIDGVNSVVVDASLREEDPMLFEFLVNFGRNNNLQIEQYCGLIPGEHTPVHHD